VKYVFANTTTQSEKKLNPHANTPAAVQMIEINRKYENTRQIHRLSKGLREIQICYFCQLWNSNASVNTLHSINKVFYDTIYNTGIVLNIFVLAVFP
jgi:hypothetical protein